MPSPEKTGKKLKAVVFDTNKTSDRYGVLKVSSTPREISCHYEIGFTETVFVDGKPVSIDATVYCNEQLTPGSTVWLGKLSSLPDPISDLMYVVSSQVFSDIKGRKKNYLSRLSRKSNSQSPTV